MEALIKAGCNVDQADNDGVTPLIVPAQDGHGEVVEALRSAEDVTLTEAELQELLRTALGAGGAAEGAAAGAGRARQLGPRTKSRLGLDGGGYADATDAAGE